MRKVLFIAYYFPPITGSGVFRSLKFAKYLPEFGWQPYVITATEDIQLHQFDPTLLEELPDEVQVWRVPAPHPQPYTALGQLLRRKPSVQSPPTQLSEETESSTVTSRPPLLKPLFRTLTWPLRLIENPPVDVQLYWALRIIPLAWRLIKQHQIDVIYTSSAPWAVLLTGLALKWLTGRPWIMDMRDPWVSDEYVCRDKGLRRKLDIRIERLALRAADRVVISSIGFVDELQTLAGPTVAAKVMEITNGYDEADFVIQTDEQITPVGERRWVHLGTTIWDGFVPLGDAIARLGPDSQALQEITFVFHGWCDPRVLEATAPNKEQFVFGPVIPHPQALALMQEAELLILLLGAQKHWSRFYTGKIFEYLRAGKPILGIGPRGVAAELIERCGVGCFVAAHETEKLIAVLRRIAGDYPAFLAEYYHPDWDMIAQYERQALTGKLAAVFNAMLKQKAAR